MSLNIKKLSKELLKINLADFIELDSYYCENYGDSYTTDRWKEENFLMDLPGKWDYSCLTLSADVMSGFIIASEKVPGTAHIHRLAIKPEYKSQGIGSVLVDQVIDYAIEKCCRRITIEASIKNSAAISFYRNLGFCKIIEKNNLNQYLKERERDSIPFDGFIEEQDGSRYAVLERVI